MVSTSILAEESGPDSRKSPKCVDEKLTQNVCLQCSANSKTLFGRFLILDVNGWLGFEFLIFLFLTFSLSIFNI